MSWRRGESEQEGALRVSGQHPQGAWVEFWLYDDDAANVFTMISPSEADPGLVISATWFDDFVARLDKEVLPQLGEVSVTPEPTPHADAPPPKNRTIASASTEGKVLGNGTVIIYDLYDWVDPAGFDDVLFDQHEGTLIAKLKDSDNTLYLIFEGAVFHMRTPIPGKSTVSADITGVSLHHELADLAISQFRDEWIADPNKPGGDNLRHYWAMFFEAGAVIDVLAESVKLRATL